VRLHWLAPDLPYVISDSPFQIVFVAKPSPIRWNMFSSCRASAMVIRGGKRLLTGNSVAWMADEDAQRFGWEAPTYGELQPAISLLYQTRSPLPVRFVTVLLTNERHNADKVNDELVVCRTGHLDSQGGPEIHRVSLSPMPMHMAETQSLVTGPRA